eukprot:maker-scaffold604_size126151-snap-gene-0.35 protein:Tk08223 transcript:maker-scaffold604_size126151-snap-gene-0.35-mRNA-1 annotation:"conserved hypothetical protein"
MTSRIPVMGTIMKTLFLVLSIPLRTLKKAMNQVPLNRTKLTYAMAFLPIARSSSTLEYYGTISEQTISDGRTKVVAMDLGLKDTLFDEYLLEDAIYLGVAGGLIILAILLYTQSFFLTIATTLSIIFSLSLAYFLYSMVFGIEFFPFMNILAAVIAIGPVNTETCRSILRLLIWDMLENTTFSIFIGLIFDFSIFAGLAILCNFLLMISWTPAALVFYQRYCQSTCCCCLVPTPGLQRIDTCRLGQLFCSIRMSLNTWCRNLFERKLPHVIMLPRYLWISVLGALFVGSVVVVFYQPGLRLPDKEQFQLFKSNHIFERYDLLYKNFFSFERGATKDISMRMPLRFLWGVKPNDNGNHLNPGDQGSLELDPTFDLTTPDAQRWMLKFCHDARKQSFYSLKMGPLLSNCFLETFKEWMDRRCKDTLSGQNHAPCCQATKFPFPKPVFDKCLVQAIGDLYATPTDFWIPGVAGPKFNISTGQVQALIVEYDAWQIFSYSHQEMSDFYHSVNNWFTDIVSTAPLELRGGFFTSYLGFYDVQNSLSHDTMLAIAIAMVVAVLVLFVCTFNLFLSIISVITVCAVIFVSIAILVLLGWKLNILESVAITLAIGLSVDFTLHYSIMYRQSIDSDKELNVIYSVTNMAAPITMAGLTTLLAGLCLIPSRVLAYIQIGTFIVIVMTVSWVYSTFFFQAILRVFGPAQTCKGPSTDMGLNPKDYYMECCETETGSSDDIVAAQKQPTPQATPTVFALSDNEEPSLTIVSNSSLPRTKASKTPNQQIVTLGHAYYGARGTVSTYDIHILPNEANCPGHHQVINVAPTSKNDRKDGTATLPMPDRSSQDRASSRSHRRSLAEVPPNPMSHKASNHSIQSSQLFETAQIHCDSPITRTDIELKKIRKPRRQWPNPTDVNKLRSRTEARKTSLATPPRTEVRPRRSRQKSLPTDVILDSFSVGPVCHMEVNFGTKEPDPLLSPTPPLLHPKPAPRHKRQAALILHRRKNSYKRAQEKAPIDDWGYGRERRKSIGHLEEEYPPVVLEVNPRTSSSLGNIIQSDDESDRFRPMQDSPSTQTVIRIPIASIPPAGSLQSSFDPRGQRPHKLKSSYHYERHPLSHSTTTILDSSHDPEPILPNRSSATPN